VQILQQNDGGFTLVELLVAMVITLVALLGLLEAIGTVGEKNLHNMQRDEAVHIGQEWMNRFRLEPFGNISTCSNYPGGCVGTLCTYSTKKVPSKLRGGTGDYQVTRTTVLSAGGDQVNAGVLVQWTYKNTVYSHEVHSIRTK
jgi:type IV pilus assembly protein PilV